jgi:RNA polymerase sigma-54 factor
MKWDFPVQGKNESIQFLSVLDDVFPFVLKKTSVLQTQKNKYLQHPGGICEIRSLFVRGMPSEAYPQISRETIKSRIRALIAGEDKNKPCSDKQLTQFLMKQGIQISRRTVTKYREELALGGMHDRRTPAGTF